MVRYRQPVFIILCALVVSALHAYEQDSFIVDVNSEPLGNMANKYEASSLSPVGEAGEWLRRINGVAAGRKGGKGFEPVIRGQQQSQLNILLNGATVLGACPGRMDPPTSYISAVGYDRIQVIKGFDSVTYGGGGSGGSVIYERDAPQFGDKYHVGRAGGLYQGNSRSVATQGDLSLGSGEGYVRTYGEYRHSGHYKDGDGNTVSSSFRSTRGGLVVAGALNDVIYLDSSLETVEDRDIYYAGSGMDSPTANANLWRLKISLDREVGWIDEQALSLYYSDVNHLMDNYSVRPRSSDSSSGLRAPSASETFGGRWLATVHAGRAEWQAGADYLKSRRNAERYKVNHWSSVETLQALIWPGVDAQQWGIFAEVEYPLFPKSSVRIGGRVDRLSTDATNAHHRHLSSANPNALYQKYYGYQAEPTDELNVSGLISWRQRLTARQWLEFRASRSVRAGDTTERYLASRGSCCHGSDDWVGNPRIRPEKHHQFDAEYAFQNGNLSLSTAAYVNDITDYILRYRIDSGTYLYRNTDARIYGVEWAAGYEFRGVKPSVAINWTRGINKTPDSLSDENLPQIPALSATVRVDYEESSWGAGSRCEFSGRQDKINNSSGRDTGISSGFGVCHLSGHYWLSRVFRLQGGIDNLFNKTYSWHVNNRSQDPFNPESLKVNEPGRLFWFGLDMVF